MLFNSPHANFAAINTRNKYACQDEEPKIAPAEICGSIWDLQQFSRIKVVALAWKSSENNTIWLVNGQLGGFRFELRRLGNF